MPPPLSLPSRGTAPLDKLKRFVVGRDCKKGCTANNVSSFVMYKQILQLWAYFVISCTNPRLQSGEPKRHRDHTTQHAHASITWCPCESSTGKALFPRDKRFKYLAVRRRYSVEAVSATLLCPACLSADKAMPGSLRTDGLQDHSALWGSPRRQQCSMTLPRPWRTVWTRKRE